MGADRNFSTLNVLLKIMFTLVSGALRIAIQAIMILPRVVSRALTILMKAGVIYKLLIDPLLRSIGAFFAGLWRGAMVHRASSKVRKEQPRDMRT